MEEHFCGNYQDVVMPIKVDVLEALLKETGYDQEKTDKLIDGFCNGFDLGYRGPENRQDKAQNLPLTVGSLDDIWEKMMKEVKLNRFVGPFELIPFEYFAQSPIGLVPKDDGKKTRLIFHLS